MTYLARHKRVAKCNRPIDKVVPVVDVQVQAIRTTVPLHVKANARNAVQVREPDDVRREETKRRSPSEDR